MTSIYEIFRQYIVVGFGNLRIYVCYVKLHHLLFSFTTTFKNDIFYQELDLLLIKNLE